MGGQDQAAEGDPGNESIRRLRMHATEFPVAGPAAGISSQIAFQRSTPVVLRNSRILCLLTMAGGIVAGFTSLCMAILCLSSLANLSASGLESAVWWAISSLVMAYGCARLWGLGRDMANYEVVLNERGVNFNLGTKKRPASLFLAWDQVTAVKRRRVGNVQQFWVVGRGGSEARFSSYTFFRPKKVARLIADRAGLTIEKI